MKQNFLFASSLLQCKIVYYKCFRYMFLNIFVKWLVVHYGISETAQQFYLTYMFIIKVQMSK